MEEMERINTISVLFASLQMVGTLLPEDLTP